MAAVSTMVAVAGLGMAAAGTVMSTSAAAQQAQAQQQALAFQRQAEEARKKAMNLDAMRRRREMVRQSIIARATALATATKQGAQFGSALSGAYGNISGRTGVNILGINQNQQLGNEIFNANIGASMAYSEAASWGAYSQVGSGLSSLGGAVMKNSGTIAQIGTYFGSGSNYSAGGGGGGF